MTEKIQKTDAQWRDQLDAMQFEVTRRAATERAFTGKYWDHKADGSYVCICCGATLFNSQSKFDSGCGWPSYSAPAVNANVTELEDYSHGMERIEVICTQCDAHLGHVFPDGPGPNGLRYCINSASLDFAPSPASPVDSKSKL